ncbi:MAG: TatD family hydrolase [Sphingobacteriales bacterium]|nr:TatD family hydrolase [Sphingobacteriales bacterium]
MVRLVICSKHGAFCADLQGAFVWVCTWYIKNELLEQQLHQLSHLLAHHRVWAVGECGLDRLCATYGICSYKHLRHRFGFRSSTRKPLVIHCVRAFDTLLQFKKTLRPRQKMAHSRI